jgi:hypothetical protein
MDLHFASPSKFLLPHSILGGPPNPLQTWVPLFLFLFFIFSFSFLLPNEPLSSLDIPPRCALPRTRSDAGGGYPPRVGAATPPLSDHLTPLSPGRLPSPRRWQGEARQGMTTRRGNSATPAESSSVWRRAWLRRATALGGHPPRHLLSSAAWICGGEAWLSLRDNDEAPATASLTLSPSLSPSPSPPLTSTPSAHLSSADPPPRHCNRSRPHRGRSCGGEGTRPRGGRGPPRRGARKQQALAGFFPRPVGLLKLRPLPLQRAHRNGLQDSVSLPPFPWTTAPTQLWRPRHGNGACACDCGLHQKEHSSRSNCTAEAIRSARSMWWLDACSPAASSWICTDRSWSDLTNSDIFQDTADTFEPHINVQSADFGSTSTQKNNQ